MAWEHVTELAQRRRHSTLTPTEQPRPANQHCSYASTQWGTAQLFPGLAIHMALQVTCPCVTEVTTPSLHTHTHTLLSSLSSGQSSALVPTVCRHQLCSVQACTGSPPSPPPPQWRSVHSTQHAQYHPPGLLTRGWALHSLVFCGHLQLCSSYCEYMNLAAHGL